MTAVIKKYYRLNNQHVLVCMTAENRSFGAWIADPSSRTMKADYALLMDIAKNKHQGEIDETAFMKFCQDNKIDPKLPRKSLKHGFDKAIGGLGLLFIPPANAGSTANDIQHMTLQ